MNTQALRINQQEDQQSDEWKLRLWEWAEKQPSWYNPGPQWFPEDLLNLKALDFHGRNISELPPEIGNLVNLVEIDLHDTQISKLPIEIGNLVNLTKIDLNDARISELPAEIWNLPNLTELNLNGNPLKALPPEIKNLTQLTTLNMRNCNLPALPPEIGCLTSLSVLDITGNNLAELPDEISGLQKLNHLYAGNNALTELPSAFGELESLEVVYLWDNKLKSIPARLNKFNSLKEFCVQNNEFMVFPEAILTIPNLKRLDISMNDASKLFPEIAALVNLTTLNLQGKETPDGKGKLTCLPAEIGNLTNLEWLNLDNNDLKELPAEIIKLKNLRQLYANDNEHLSLYKYQGDWIERQRRSEKGFYWACTGINYNPSEKDIIPPHDVKDVLIGEVSDNLIFLQKIIEADASVFVFFKTNQKDDSNNTAVLTILDNSQRRLCPTLGVPDGFVRLKISGDGNIRTLDLCTASTYSTVHYVSTGVCKEHGLQSFGRNPLIDDTLKEEIQRRRTASKCIFGSFNNFKYKDQALLESEYCRSIPTQDQDLESLGSLLDFADGPFYAFLTESDFIHFPGKFKASLDQWNITRRFGLVFGAKHYQRRYSDFGYDNWWVEVRADSARLGFDKRRRFLIQESPRGQIELEWSRYYSAIFKYFYEGKKLLAINYHDMPSLDSAESEIANLNMKYHPIPDNLMDDVFILSTQISSDVASDEHNFASSDFADLRDNWKSTEN